MSSEKEERPSALNSADPIRNFSLSLEQRIRALTIGVPAWAARKRKIEDTEDALVAELVSLHGKLALAGHCPEDIELAMTAAATRFDLAKLNALVAAHNRYYPIEANLPLDRNGYLAHGRPWRPEEPYTASRLVALARAEIEREEG